MYICTEVSIAAISPNF